VPEHVISTLHLVRNHEGDHTVLELVDYNEMIESVSFANPDTVYGEDDVDKGSCSGNSPSQNTSSEKKVTPSSPKPIEGNSLNKEDKSDADSSPGPLKYDHSSTRNMHGQGSSTLDQSGDSFDDNADISYDRSTGELSSDSKISYFSKALSAFRDRGMKDSTRKNYYRK